MSWFGYCVCFFVIGRGQQKKRRKKTHGGGGVSIEQRIESIQRDPPSRPTPPASPRTHRAGTQLSISRHGRLSRFPCAAAFSCCVLFLRIVWVQS